MSVRCSSATRNPSPVSWCPIQISGMRVGLRRRGAAGGPPRSSRSPRRSAALPRRSRRRRSRAGGGRTARRASPNSARLAPLRAHSSAACEVSKQRPSPDFSQRYRVLSRSQMMCPNQRPPKYQGYGGRFSIRRSTPRVSSAARLSRQPGVGGVPVVVAGPGRHAPDVEHHLRPERELLRVEREVAARAPGPGRWSSGFAPPRDGAGPRPPHRRSMSMSWAYSAA